LVCLDRTLNSPFYGLNPNKIHLLLFLEYNSNTKVFGKKCGEHDGESGQSTEKVVIGKSGFRKNTIE